MSIITAIIIVTVAIYVELHEDDDSSLKIIGDKRY
jgi:hypothetical protein